jgi:16S rRNA (cytidine1402-2'-O)-methyltransferase
MKKGTLYLIPTTLGPGPVEAVIPAGVLDISRRLVKFIAENERTARRYLKAAGTNIPLDDLQFGILNKHTRPEEIPTLCEPLLNGFDMGLISEAGLPGIADPGAAVVAWCHRNGVHAVPGTGPSSIVLALIASGFNGQEFTFRGYLPIERRERQQALRQMEREVANSGPSQIFMETPFRNEKLLEQILENCNSTTELCIACDISLENAFIRTAAVAHWKKQKPNLRKRPCIFIIGVSQ